jgi:SAM-dependent methyltransferase
MSSPHSRILATLCCPVTREPLVWGADAVATVSGSHRFAVSACGVPLFAEQFCSAEGRAQQQHYDRVAAAYMESLAYPHTQAYMEALDEAFLRVIEPGRLGCVAEICCGRGESFRLLADRIEAGIGVDVSLSMLEAAQRDLGGDRFTFVQGDATVLPIADAQYDTVVMFGGIHHVNDRQKLFSEVFRILKPGGRFYFREPVSDFFLWRWLRSVIYRLSPALDHETERPLLHEETVPVLEKAGFVPERWVTYGFLGFCLFMNSDVLVFNRLFRYVPGIRGVTRAFARLDELTLRLPGMSRAGLMVLGSARKPEAAA